MRTRRILGIAALGAAAATMTLVPAAGAQEVDVTYGASSSGEALRLSVFGQELTVGRTVAGLDSTLAATAAGTGLATPLFDGGVTSADVSGSGSDGSADEVCDSDLPADIPDIPGLSIDLACSSSLAEILDGVPHAAATGRVGDITVNPIDPLRDTPLGTLVVEPVQEQVDALVGTLSEYAAQVDNATVDLGVEDTLGDLVDALFGGADLVSISLGNASTESFVGTDTLSTSCAANGGRIDVLDAPPVGDVDPDPVMSFIIGSAATSVEASTADASATPVVDPAIVTVIVPSLGINQAVGPGQTLEIPLPEPLGSSTIAVADGRTGVNDAGQTFATADAVLLDLLNGEQMMGGVELSLANCTSVGGVAIQAQTTTTTTTPVPQLPRTGGTSPNTLALAATLGLAGLGLALVRRSGGTA